MAESRIIIDMGKGFDLIFKTLGGEPTSEIFDLEKHGVANNNHDEFGERTPADSEKRGR